MGSKERPAKEAMVEVPLMMPAWLRLPGALVWPGRRAQVQEPLRPRPPPERPRGEQRGWPAAARRGEVGRRAVLPPALGLAVRVAPAPEAARLAQAPRGWPGPGPAPLVPGPGRVRRAAAPAEEAGVEAAPDALLPLLSRGEPGRPRCR